MKKIKVMLVSCLSVMMLFSVCLAIGLFPNPAKSVSAETIKAYYIDGSNNSTVEYTDCDAATGGRGLVATFTKPTGTAMISFGRSFPASISSQSLTRAVGAFPMAKIPFSPISAALSILAQARVHPLSAAVPATSSSDIKQYI